MLYKVVMHLKLIVQIKELVEECDTPLVQNTADEYNRIKVELSQNSSESSLDSESGDKTPGAKVNEDTGKGKNWKWSGTDFIKSPTAEPWVIYLKSLTCKSTSGNLFLYLIHILVKACHILKLEKTNSVLYIILNFDSDLFSEQEMTRLNMEAAAMCLISIVDDLVVGESAERSKWLEEINPAAMKLKSFLEIVYQKILLIVMFLNIKVWLMCF